MIFLTQPSFSDTAADLTDVDLHLQIIEVSRLQDVFVEGGRNKKDPVPYAWDGRFEALLIHGMLLCMEWSFHRGYDDKMFWKFSRYADAMKGFKYEPLAWFRDEDVIASHRSHLVRTNPREYGEKWPKTPKRMPVLWPVVSKEDPAVYELKVARADLPRLKSGKLKIPARISKRVVNLK